jgi:hypothetical protein
MILYYMVSLVYLGFIGAEMHGIFRTLIYTWIKGLYYWIWISKKSIIKPLKVEFNRIPLWRKC